MSVNGSNRSHYSAILIKDGGIVLLGNVVIYGGYFG